MAGTFAIAFAQFAIDALILALADSPYSKSADYSEESAERTDEPAIESRNKQIERDGSQKDGEYQPSALVKSPGHRSKVCGAISDGQ